MNKHSRTAEELNDLEEFKFRFWDYPEETQLCAFHAYHYSDGFARAASAKEAFAACKMQHMWENAFEAIALLLGVPGNIMAAVTALSMDRGTTSNYIFFLSVGDLFTLLARAATPMTTTNSFELFKMTVGFVPNSMLVLIVFERFMAVRHPWRKKRWFTVKAGLWSIAMVLLLYIMILVTWSNLSFRVESAGTFFGLSMVLFLLSCPFIIVLNTLTIKSLRYMARLKSMGTLTLKFWSHVENSVTYIMVLASAVFIALNGPFFIVTLVWFLCSKLWTGEPLVKITNILFIMTFTYWLTFLHHALNFYIYVLGTKRFRLQSIIIIKAWMPGAFKRVIAPSHTMMNARSSVQRPRPNVEKNLESQTDMSPSKYRSHESSI